MRRTPFWKLLLAGTGYMLPESPMGTIITAAMSFIISNVIAGGFHCGYYDKLNMNEQN